MKRLTTKNKKKISDVSLKLLDGIRELATLLDRPDIVKKVDEYIKSNEGSVSSTKKKIILKESRQRQSKQYGIKRSKSKK